MEGQEESRGVMGEGGKGRNGKGKEKERGGREREEGKRKWGPEGTFQQIRIYDYSPDNKACSGCGVCSGRTVRRGGVRHGG